MHSTNPSSRPSATEHRSRAAAPSDRNCAQPRWWSGRPFTATIASADAASPSTARCGSPSRRAPPPRTASYRVPWTRSTTSAATGPSASTAHRLVANHGMPRGRVGRPVERIDHHGHGRSGWCRPLSSLSTPTPAATSTSSAAASAARSLWCWPGIVSGQAPVDLARQGLDDRGRRRRAGSRAARRDRGRRSRPGDGSRRVSLPAEK